jgi:hypothetical protein
MLLALLSTIRCLFPAGTFRGNGQFDIMSGPQLEVYAGAVVTLSGAHASLWSVSSVLRVGQKRSGWLALASALGRVHSVRFRWLQGTLDLRDAGTRLHLLPPGHYATTGAKFLGNVRSIVWLPLNLAS